VLERLNKAFVGRELKMVELKERIRELEKKSGKRSYGTSSFSIVTGSAVIRGVILYASFPG
jgi:hypothetical protein